VERDRFGCRRAREDLYAYAPKKWKCLLMYEDHVCLIVQRFIRWCISRSKDITLIASRHLRDANTAAARYRRTPRDPVVRDACRRLAAHRLTPGAHALHAAVVNMAREDAAADELAGFARKAAAKRTLEGRRSARAAQQMLDLVNAAALAEEVQAEEEDDLDQSAATLQAAFRGRSSRRRGRRARQRYLARCAARVTNAIRCAETNHWFGWS
jgi:hypothetical protein